MKKFIGILLAGLVLVGCDEDAYQPTWDDIAEPQARTVTMATEVVQLNKEEMVSIQVAEKGYTHSLKNDDYLVCWQDEVYTNCESYALTDTLELTLYGKATIMLYSEHAMYNLQSEHYTVTGQATVGAGEDSFTIFAENTQWDYVTIEAADGEDFTATLGYADMVQSPDGYLYAYTVADTQLTTSTGQYIEVFHEGNVHSRYVLDLDESGSIVVEEPDFSERDVIIIRPTKE